MSRQYFIVEVDPGGPLGYRWDQEQVAAFATALGVSERQIIVVEGAHVHVVDVKEPGEDRSK